MWRWHIEYHIQTNEISALMFLDMQMVVHMYDQNIHI